MAIATGFDFQPLDDGNVLIECFGDDGKTFNKQIVSIDVMKNMAMMSVLTDVALRKGPQVAQEIIGKLSSGQRQSNTHQEVNVNDINSIWIAEIVDDRGFCSDGPLETVKYFREKITALKWLANWIGKEIEDYEDEDKRRRFLSLIEAEDFDRLFKDYQDDFDDGVLKLSVYQRTVN